MAGALAVRGRGACRTPERVGREGILVLGHQEHDPEVARDSGPDPGKGQFVSSRIVPAERGPSGTRAPAPLTGVRGD
jgi:hypothetical protein